MCCLELRLNRFLDFLQAGAWHNGLIIDSLHVRVSLVDVGSIIVRADGLIIDVIGVFVTLALVVLFVMLMSMLFLGERTN